MNTPAPGPFFADDSAGDAVVRESLDRSVRLTGLRAECERQEVLALAKALKVGVDRAASQVGVPTSRKHWEIEAIILEFATALGVSPRSMTRRTNQVYLLLTAFPAGLEALQDREYPASHALALADAGAVITDPDQQARYASRAVRLARAKEYTLARWRTVLKALVEDITHPTVVERHQAAREERCVRAYPWRDGMSELVAILPTELAAGILSRIDAYARRIKNAGDPRTVEQIRADVLADILLTSVPTGGPTGVEAITARVNVVIPADVVEAETPEEAPAGSMILGFGTISPEVARRIAGNTITWGGSVIHPDTGVLLTNLERLPNTRQRAFLRVRDEHCRFPGCRARPDRCEADHTVAWSDGGATTVTNLALVCKQHHSLKHQTRWKVEQLGDGRLKWTSPLGRVYIDEPEPVVRFQATKPPPEPEPRSGSAGSPASWSA